MEEGRAMNRAGAVFSVVIFVAGSVFAQVHIRENATITSRPVNAVQGPFHRRRTPSGIIPTVSRG